MTGKSMQVLLIDDDVELAALLKDYLTRDGFDVAVIHDGKIGVEEALSGSYAIIVLDVMMPRQDGIDALRRIRTASQIPVLMLTGKGDDADRILGLELGADDYVAKPCTPRELAARIRAILRRSGNPAGHDAAETPLVTDRLVIWPERRHAEWDGEPVALTTTEFNLLEVLVRNAGRPVSKNDLSELALGRPLARFDRNIDVHLSSLRRKLGVLTGGQSCIQTVRRMGYQFIKE